MLLGKDDEFKIEMLNKNPNVLILDTNDFIKTEKGLDIRNLPKAHSNVFNEFIIIKEI
jgi:hypothetical protein